MNFFIFFQASELEFFSFNTDTQFEYNCGGTVDTINVASPPQREDVIEFTIPNSGVLPDGAVEVFI